MTLSSGGLSQLARDQASSRAVSEIAGACQWLASNGSHIVATSNADTSICLLSVGTSTCFSKQQLPVFGFPNCWHVEQLDSADAFRKLACVAKCVRQHGFNAESAERGAAGLRKQHSQKSCPFAAAHLHSICGRPAPRMNGIIPTTRTFQNICLAEFISSPSRKTQNWLPWTTSISQTGFARTTLIIKVAAAEITKCVARP